MRLSGTTWTQTVTAPNGASVSYSLDMRGQSQGRALLEVELYNTARQYFTTVFSNIILRIAQPNDEGFCFNANANYNNLRPGETCNGIALSSDGFTCVIDSCTFSPIASAPDGFPVVSGSGNSNSGGSVVDGNSNGGGQSGNNGVVVVNPDNGGSGNSPNGNSNGSPPIPNRTNPPPPATITAMPRTIVHNETILVQQTSDGRIVNVTYVIPVYTTDYFPEQTSTVTKSAGVRILSFLVKVAIIFNLLK